MNPAKTFDQKLRDILEDVDLESWLDQYASLKPGGQPSERVLETCPKCLNSNYKVYVNVERHLWICHVCDWGRHGRLIDLMSEVSGKTALQIYKELAQTVTPAPASDFMARLQGAFAPIEADGPAPIEMVHIPGDADFSGIITTRVMNYAVRRGLSHADVQMYQLRAAVKLFRFTGPFLVFPVLNRGIPVAWQGRRAEGKSEPKYVSSDHIGNFLWPIDTQFSDRIAADRHVVLVEGVFDAIALWKMDVPALCTFGKKISEKQVVLLQQLGVKSVAIMWDADAAVTSMQKRMNGPRGLRGEIEFSALRLKRNFKVYVVDLSDPPEFDGVSKADPGEALCHPEIVVWLQERMATAIDVDSTQFFQWRLG
jgi:hypothetical protein